MNPTDKNEPRCGGSGYIERHILSCARDGCDGTCIRKCEGCPDCKSGTCSECKKEKCGRDLKKEPDHVVAAFHYREHDACHGHPKPEPEEDYTIGEAVRDITKVGVCPAPKSAVRKIVERLVASREEAAVKKERERCVNKLLDLAAIASIQEPQP